MTKCLHSCAYCFPGPCKDGCGACPNCANANKAAPAQPAASLNTAGSNHLDPIGAASEAALPAYLEGRPTRERCAMCQRISPVGFHVPTEVWQACVHPHWQNSVLCLGCFISQADEKLIAWDRHITFYPVSLKSHLEIGP